MSDETTLDRAHDAMEAGGDTDRLRFYERLADAELFLMLAREAADDKLEPKVYPVEGGSYVLVFDRLERLAEFAGSITPYAAMSGRAIISLLSAQDIGLGVNLGVARSSSLFSPDIVDWLAETIAVKPKEMTERPHAFLPPNSVPQAVLTGLGTKLALAVGLARAAYLVDVQYDGGRNGHLLAFVDARPGSEPALSQAVSEALVFSGVEAGEIDVAFFAPSDPVCARLARTGLRFDLPETPVRTIRAQSAPGMDPSKPPNLR